MPEINILAVVVAALSSFLLGGVWYSALYAKAWMRENGLTEEALAERNPAAVFGGSFMLCLVAAAVFAMFLGPSPDLTFALGAGFAAGLFWVAASIGVNYLFSKRSFVLFAIDGGYHTLQFTLYGLVLGLWP